MEEVELGIGRAWQRIGGIELEISTWSDQAGQILSTTRAQIALASKLNESRWKSYESLGLIRK